MKYLYTLSNLGGGSLQDGAFEASSFSDARIEARKAVEPGFDPSFPKTARWSRGRFSTKTLTVVSFIQRNGRGSHIAYA